MAADGAPGRTVDLPDLAAVARLGAVIAAALRPGDVVALSGPLGAGKTTLARAIVTALGHTGEVPSPSFAILEPYAPPQVRLPVVHADFYRLRSPEEADELGLDDYRDGAALIAEWPENAGGFAHEAGCLALTFLPFDNSGEQNPPPPRRLLVEPGQEWLSRPLWTLP